MSKAAALQKVDTVPETAPVSIRVPEAKDAKAIRQLVEETGVMDVNAEYAYMLLGEHFKETCAVAERNELLSGFVSAYVPPNQLDVLFVWQMAVSSTYRRRGLGRAMLHEILKRKPCEHIKYVHATIAPSNSASRSLFASLARDLGANLREQSMFPAGYFSNQHEDEPLLVIGPLVYLPREENV